MQANQFRLTRESEQIHPCFYCQALTTAHSESAQGPDLGLSGALCHFFMTSGLLSEEIGSLRARGEVSEIETQTWSSSINPQRQTEKRLARHIKTSLSNTSAHELQITPGQS